MVQSSGHCIGNHTYELRSVKNHVDYMEMKQARAANGYRKNGTWLLNTEGFMG